MPEVIALSEAIVSLGEFVIQVVDFVLQFVPGCFCGLQLDFQFNEVSLEPLFLAGSFEPELL